MKLKSAFALGALFFSLTAKATDVVIYDASIHVFAGITNKGAKVLVNGKKSGFFSSSLVSKDAYEADENLRITEKFFREKFGLNSFDNKGSPIEAIVRIGRFGIGNFRVDFLRSRENAAWMPGPGLFIFGVGDKEGLRGFTHALDAIAHEYTHAIDQYSVGLKMGGQSGALKEHLADVFGQWIQVASGKGADDFLIGESIVTKDLLKYLNEKRGYPVKALRDMLQPHFSLTPQPAHMNEIAPAHGPNCVPNENNDMCGVHSLNGIPNRAVALMVQQLGWEKVGRIVFNVMTKRLTPNADFQAYAAEMVGECYSQLSAQECSAVNNSFRAVGL